MSRKPKIIIALISFGIFLSIFIGVIFVVIDQSKYGYTLLNDDTYKFSSYSGRDKTITIPSTYKDKPVTIMGSKCFKIGNKIKTINLPDSITLIEDNAFRYCYRLEELNFGSGLKKIGSHILWDCNKLKKIAFKDGLEYLSEESLGGISCLEDIVFPKSINYLAENVLLYDYHLKHIFYEGTEEEWDNTKNESNFIKIDMRSGFAKDNLPWWKVLYFYSEEKPTDNEQYWHYVDGVPTIWS